MDLMTTYTRTLIGELPGAVHADSAPEQLPGSFLGGLRGLSVPHRQRVQRHAPPLEAARGPSALPYRLVSVGRCGQGEGCGGRCAVSCTATRGCPGTLSSSSPTGE